MPRKAKKAKAATLLPIMPLRDTVIFPNTMFPVLVGRDTSVQAVRLASESDKRVLLLTQKNPEQEDPSINDLHTVGTLAQVVQILNLPNGLMKVLVNGLATAKLVSTTTKKGLMMAEIEIEEAPVIKSERVLNSLVRKTREKFEKYVLVNPELPEELLLSFSQIDQPMHLVYYMAGYLELELDAKQSLLEAQPLEAKFREVLQFLTSELQMLEVSNEINEKVQEDIQESQRKFFIQEQIRALQEELDEEGFADPELARLKEQIDKLPMSEQARTKVLEEMDRLKKTPQMSPEYTVARNYVDWIISMPWGVFSEDNLEISAVETALNNDHYGLEKPKERILEHIAVLNLVRQMKGQILCFVGPPGTGKTSLAKSIAEAMGRKMVRISVGGVNDEAEIRGHRKTYIGSMPGRIIQSIKKAGTMNPVIILDEIDKLSHDFRGDPSSAVLEVLDPEQNDTFNDHYLDVDFDLSNVMFITTANVASNIQPALLDRMEVINLPGYLEHDKLEISRHHMIPKLLKAHGLTAKKVVFKDDAVLEIIRKYTVEAGVRQLEQQIASVLRKVAKQEVSLRAKGETSKKRTITLADVPGLLGVEKYRDRDLDKRDKIGSVNGLAWTSTGGSILQIDVAVMKGKSKLTLTGQLGDVMKESAQAALTFIRSNAEPFGIPADYFETHEFHLHIPEGAIPKDGPSAGLAMALAILSIATNRPIRHDVALTGEITLRGEVYAIGGLNEKLLAAQRNRIQKVLIPKDNERDLIEIPAKVKDGLVIVSVNTLDEALPHIFRIPS
jgi:ATP-dependent Lon protease